MAVSLSPLTGIPGISNFGGYFGAFLKYAGFDVLKITDKADEKTMIVIDGFRQEVSLEEAPADDEAFDLERHITERFVDAGYNKRHIAFMSTGIGAANTAYGCINSHYYDVNKPLPDGGRGLFRTKQAGARLHKVVKEVDPQSLKMYRKGELRTLVQVYYEERGWSPVGIPSKSELKYIGLWNYLTNESKERLKELQ